MNDKDHYHSFMLKFLDEYRNRPSHTPGSPPGSACSSTGLLRRSVGGYLADHRCAIPPRYILASRRGTSASVGSSSCLCSWGCSSCVRPSAGHTACARSRPQLRIAPGDELRADDDDGPISK